MIEQNQLEEVRKLKEGLINKLKLFQLSTVAIVEANSEPSVRFGRLQKARRNLAESLLHTILSGLYIDTGELTEGPKIICICGSTRFTEEMLVKQWELTKQGYITLSWCALPDSYFQGDDKIHIGDKEGVKLIVDELHKRKIDLCDEVLVITSGKATNGLKHIGESTTSEMSYAYQIHKPIHFYPHEQALEDNWNHKVVHAKAARARFVSIGELEK